MTTDATASLLDALDELMRRYVAFPNEADRHAVAAWVIHCWALDAFDSTPRLAVLSPEKGSGKTRLLEVLELVVPGPIHAVNLSASALFRLVSDEERTTTLLLDEADTYLSAKTAANHEDLRGLVNAGHRRGAKAYRVRAEAGNVVEAFEAFAPVALAGIGDLPDTITDRSVVLAMKRRAPSEVVESFRRRRALEDTTSLRAALEQWGPQIASALDGVEPTMPEGVVDRPADVWEPLIAISDLAGEPWSARVRTAATAAVLGREPDELTVGARLLGDLQSIFETAGDPDSIATADLLDRLHADEEAPWGDWYGSPLDARHLAKMLKRYGIRSTTVRPDDRPEKPAKGYRREALIDAWARWLPPVSDRPLQALHGLQEPEQTPREDPSNGSNRRNAPEATDTLRCADCDAPATATDRDGTERCSEHVSWGGSAA